MSDGTRKVTAISEVTGMEGDVITMQDIFLFERTGIGRTAACGRFRATGIRPKCERDRGGGRSAARRTMFEHVKLVA